MVTVFYKAEQVAIRDISRNQDVFVEEGTQNAM